MTTFDLEDLIRMDKIAEEMRQDGHNGHSDYNCGGWQCHNHCRACEQEAGQLCPYCGTASWEKCSDSCPAETAHRYAQVHPTHSYKPEEFQYDNGHFWIVVSHCPLIHREVFLDRNNNLFEIEWNNGDVSHVLVNGKSVW